MLAAFVLALAAMIRLVLGPALIVSASILFKYLALLAVLEFLC